MAPGRFLRGVNKVLGIDPQARYARLPQDLEQRAKDTVSPGQVYLEEEPTVGEWFRDLKPTGEGTKNYIKSLFPSALWIWRYNWRWLFGDAIAGLTIGFVVVPQAMAYALLANLSPEYGLYTSFVGAAIYWLFGTSKDIVIGTTAVGSLLVGRVVTTVQEEHGDKYSAEEVAKTLSIVAGSTLLFLGLLRLGWLIEFIPYVPISAFVTAASITIMLTQAPVALGIKGINTRRAPYLVFIDTVKNLGKTQLDAAIGITSIVLLFAVRDFCAYMEKRQPQKKRMWATISALRQVSAMILYTLISFLVNRTHRDYPKFRIVSHIEVGFSHAGVPKPTGELVSLIVPELPAIVIILIIEHIAIAKSFGRIFNYTITPSQEIVAQGAANLLGPFVGGYVCTGSFGASAVLSKAGVRTPLAGLFSAMILVLALYVLTGVFFYIPMAALAGLIIHAVSNLMTPPKTLYKYWQLSPFELFIWIAGVIVAIFESLELSIYVTIGLSAALLLIRLSRSKGRFMGRLKVYEITGDADEPFHGKLSSDESSVDEDAQAGCHRLQPCRTTFIPLDRKDGSNPAIEVESPHPGVFIYRFTEGFNYTNQAHHVEALQTHILANTRRTTEEQFAHKSDRLWCDPGPGKDAEAAKSRPILRAVILDCSAVNNIDITSVQGLIDLRNSFDRYAAPEIVDWHFANVYNRWARRTLAVAGFGFPSNESLEWLGRWKPAYTVAMLSSTHPDQDGAGQGMTNGAAGDTDLEHAKEQSEKTLQGQKTPEEKGPTMPDGVPFSKLTTVHGVDRPFFHVDLGEAVDIAVRNARDKDRFMSE